MSGILITGGAGFIGTNLAKTLAEGGSKVIIFDNLSRPGVERNARWLRTHYPSSIEFQNGDIRDFRQVTSVIRQANMVFHLAAQVAVTTSLVDPREDSAVNIGGTLNVLEAIRNSPQRPPLLFTSTNKVYGELRGLHLRTQGMRYQPTDMNTRKGIGETSPLDFHSPYGCSKGAADQYVIDYARSFGLAAVVFRMSCIYGPHQMGTEDQGWIAHFLLRALGGEPLWLFGNGMQVRDILYVDDLVDALLMARDRINTLSGQAFNMGGGPANTISLLELLQVIEKLTGHSIDYRLCEWRAGDQRYYVSDTRRFQKATGWTPRVDVAEGVSCLYNWLSDEAEFGWATTSARNGHALLAR